mgnify:CR=1 FL=1
MSFIVKFPARIILNAIALYVCAAYFPQFILGGGWYTLLVGALVLAVLYTFLRPILKLVTLPLSWVTFGLFNIVITIFLLWIADQFLTQLTIEGFKTLFWTAIIIGLANSF